MLSGNNDRALTMYKHVNDAFVFFLQRWREILESKTLDMYQYNLLNSCVACDEYYDVIVKTMEGIFTSRQNVDDCKAEAFLLVKNAFILEKYNRPLKYTLVRVLNSKIESKQKGDVADDKNGNFYTSLNRIKYQLVAPLRQLKDLYLDYILAELKYAIDIGDRDLVNSTIGILVPQCIFCGWSARGLIELSDIFETTDDPEAKWQNFQNRIKSTNYDSYQIYYSIKIETRTGITAASVRETISRMDLEVLSGREIIDQNNDNAELRSKVHAESTYIATSIRTPDTYSAVLRSINILNSKLSVATFYNIINPWIANSPQIIVVNLSTQKTEGLKLTDIFKTYDYVDSNNSVFADTNSIITNPTMDEVKSKISAVFAYTNLSRSSVFQETKFISLWIALESVMHTGQYQDIITHIKAVLPEILATRYIYRMVRNFVEDCIRCGFKKCDDLSLNLEYPNKKMVVHQMIELFRSTTDYPTLLDKCKDCQLLVYRCEEIHDLLNSAEKISEKMIHYTQKIRWHIQRLYRIRNEITHSAFNEDKSLVIYIEHLYTYLSQLMSEIVYYIANKGAKSVDEAYATILENYRTYMELINNGILGVPDVLPNGIIEFN